MNRALLSLGLLLLPLPMPAAQAASSEGPGSFETIPPQAVDSGPIRPFVQATRRIQGLLERATILLEGAPGLPFQDRMALGQAVEDLSTLLRSNAEAIRKGEPSLDHLKSLERRLEALEGQISAIEARLPGATSVPEASAATPIREASGGSFGSIHSTQGRAGAFYLETGLGRRSGDFGSPTTSTLSFAYGTVGFASSRYDVSATLPALQLKTSGNGTSETATGTGDVLLRSVRRLMGTGLSGFSLDGGLALKLPTASDSKGLGTGQVDVGAFLASHYHWSRLQVSALGGWIKTGGFGGGGMGGGMMGSGTGATGTEDGRQGGAYVLGTSLSLYRERTKLSLSFEARGPQFSNTPGVREITADMFHLFNPKWAMKASVFVGLSNGGPKNGLGLAIVYWP